MRSLRRRAAVRSNTFVSLRADGSTAHTEGTEGGEGTEDLRGAPPCPHRPPRPPYELFKVDQPERALYFRFALKKPNVFVHASSAAALSYACPLGLAKA